jgi:hypothetical protein
MESIFPEFSCLSGKKKMEFGFQPYGHSGFLPVSKNTCRESLVMFKENVL